MTVTKRRWRGLTGRAVLLALAAALIPLPVAASDAGPVHTTATTTKAVSLHQAVVRAARAAAQTAPAVTPAPKQQRRADQSGGNGAMSFFKSGPGLIALTVMAVGTGYAIYSANHDRIVSPGRK